MTPRRLAFEWLHKGLGWGALVAGAVVMALGVRMLGAPDALVLVLVLPYLVFAGFALVQARRRRRVDTYVAIWGRLRSPLLRPGIVPPPGQGEPGAA
jgi:hypothetical protein